MAKDGSLEECSRRKLATDGRLSLMTLSRYGEAMQKDGSPCPTFVLLSKIRNNVARLHRIITKYEEGGVKKIITSAKTSNISKGKIPAGQQVNRVGKYLKKHLDGAYSIKMSPNMCDVYVTLLYQIPYLQRIPGKGKEYNGIHEMTLDINVTTYQNKVRVNVIELSPEERTLGFDCYSPEKLQNLEQAKELILNKIIKKVSKAYQDYDFVF